MGSSTSKINKIIAIGFVNYSAQGIYSSYGLKDNIFPHKITLPRIIAERVILDEKINQIEKIFSEHILNMPEYINKNEKETSIKTQPYILAQNLLSTGQNIDKIHYDSRIHGNHLILCKENIFELNDSIGQLSNLLLLQLCCNYITKIPATIIYLKNLTTLSLSRNQLRTIPEEICELTNLTHVDLSYNFLQDVPKNIKKLSSISYLNLENNVFVKIPYQICKLRSLRTFIFANNKIKDVPLEILKMPFLVDFNATTPTLKFENVLQEVGKLDLKELCLRNIVLKLLPVRKNLDISTIEKIVNVKECGFCGGPIFDSYFLIKTTVQFETEKYPVKYIICKKHYGNEKNKIIALFSKKNNSIPYKLFIRYKTNVNDIFDQKHLPRRRFTCNLFSDTMPLTNLSKYKNQAAKKQIFQKLDHFIYN